MKKAPPPSVCDTGCHSKAHTILNSKYSPMNSKQSSCFQILGFNNDLKYIYFDRSMN